MKSSNVYFLQQYSHLQYNTGGIGFIDIEKMFLKMGFTPIIEKNNCPILLRYFSLLLVFFTLKKNDSIIVIFPIFSRYFKILIFLLHLKKNIHWILFIGDIDGLRTCNESLLEKEKQFFNSFQHFIVHNNAMQQWFENNFKNKTCTQLSFFDFLTDIKNIPTENFTPIKKIVFAGNIDKSAFVKKLTELNVTKISFHIYGNKQVENNTSSVFFNGLNNPFKTIEIIKGDYGLIWDGEFLEECKGIFGSYLQYNSQHKLSTYIVCNLPIIAWENSAIAPLILKYKIGILVSSLYELEHNVLNVNDIQYKEMKNNLIPLATKIRSGFFTQKAIEEALHKI